MLECVWLTLESASVQHEITFWDSIFIWEGIVMKIVLSMLWDFVFLKNPISMSHQHMPVKFVESKFECFPPGIHTFVNPSTYLQMPLLSHRLIQWARSCYRRMFESRFWFRICLLGVDVLSMPRLSCRPWYWSQTFQMLLGRWLLSYLSAENRPSYEPIEIYIMLWRTFGLYQLHMSFYQWIRHSLCSRGRFAWNASKQGYLHGCRICSHPDSSPMAIWAFSFYPLIVI